MVKLQDIANLTGLSIATVSYSLNNDPRIPDDTKHIVLEAAQKLGYKGKAGKRITEHQTKQIVLCLNTVSGEVFTTIIDAMRNTLNLNQCELLVYLGSDISNIKGVDGLIILNSKVSNDDIDKIASRHIPMVLMDREHSFRHSVCVTADNFQGGYEVTRYALSSGAQSFVFVGGPQESFESKLRYDGFISALSSANLVNNTFTIQTDFTYDGGFTASRFILENNKNVDAIVCANDEIALGILAGLKKRGLDKKIIVTGFDGTTSALSPSPKFATAKIDHKYWATTSAYVMIQMLSNINQKSIKIPAELIIP